MARNRKPTPTKTVIIKIASELFFENGFTKTTSTEICKKADISPGNLTFYFPNKESILATLVQMMIDFQWKEMEAQTDEGKSSLLAYCLELTTLAAIGEEIPQMHEFLTAAYSHPTTLDLIRSNDVEKIKRVFAEYTEGWDDDKFTETETLISGIEYATLMHTEHTATLEHRIEGALNTIKHAPFKTIPQFMNRFEDSSEGLPAVVVEKPRHVFKQKILRVPGLSHSHDLVKERTSCVVKSESPSGDGEWLTRKAAADEIDFG